jgi:hypothetical protein
MAFRKAFLHLLTFIVLTTLQASGQQSKTKIYKGDGYTLEYPSHWRVTNENGIINFFPAEEYGALTFSRQSGVDIPLEKTKEFIIDISEVKDDPAKVKMTKKGDVTEFYYEHVYEGVKWLTKLIRKNKDFYLLTVNCELASWNLNKDVFISAMNSFKIE